MKWWIPLPLPVATDTRLSAPRDHLGVLPGGLAGIHNAVLRAHTALLGGVIRLHTGFLLPTVVFGGLAVSAAQLLLAFGPECVRARPLRRAAVVALALHAVWPHLREAAPPLALALLLAGGGQCARHGCRALQIAACMCLAAPAVWWRVAVVEIPRSARFEPCLAGLAAWAACRRPAPAARLRVAAAMAVLAAAAGLWAPLRWAFVALGLLLCPAVYRGGGRGVAPGLLALAPCAALALALPFPPLPPLQPLLVLTPMLPPLLPARARVLVPAALCALLTCAAPEQWAWWRQRAALARPALGVLSLTVSVCLLRPWYCALGAETAALRRRPSAISSGARDFWLGARTAGAETGSGVGPGVGLADHLPRYPMAWADLAPALWTDAAVRSVRRAAAGVGSAVMSLRPQQQQQQEQEQPVSVPPPAMTPFICDGGGGKQQPSRLPAGPGVHAAIPRWQISPSGPERLSDCIAAAAAESTAGGRTRGYGAAFPPTPQLPSRLLSASAFGSNNVSGRCSNCGFCQQQDNQQQLQQQQQQRLQQLQLQQLQQLHQQQGQKQPHGRQDAHARELTPGWVACDWEFLSQQAAAAGLRPPIDYRAGRGRSVFVVPEEGRSGISFLHRTNIVTATTTTRIPIGTTTTRIPAGSATSTSTSISMWAGMGTGRGKPASGEAATGMPARRKPWRRGDPFPGPLHGNRDLAPAPLFRNAEAEAAAEPGAGTLVLLLALGAIQSVVRWWWAGWCAVVAAGLGIDVQIDGGSGGDIPEGLQVIRTRGHGGSVPPAWELKFA